MMNNRSKTYAGFWQRAAAFALDYVIILGYLIAITLVFLFLNRLSAEAQRLFDERFQAQFVAFLLITFPVTFYFAIGESSARQATWGKQRLGLRVIDDKGRRIHFLRAFCRTLLKFIPWEISHTLIWEIYFSPGVDSSLIDFGFVLVYGLIGLNLASLIITKTHRTLYDFLAGAYVVRNS